eukprot:7611019-Pyramimonas_sp.AAC.1
MTKRRLRAAILAGRTRRKTRRMNSTSRRALPCYTYATHEPQTPPKDFGGQHLATRRSVQKQATSWAVKAKVQLSGRATGYDD